MNTLSTLEEWLDLKANHVRRRVRIIMLLDAADYAVISPISQSRLHAFAFLADVLSPIYHLRPSTGKILKRRDGPYFPELQWEIDCLVGAGLVEVSKLRPIVDDSRACLDAQFTLNRQTARTILELVHKEQPFTKLRDFFRELASALGDVRDDDLDAATRADVTWESGPAGALIDYDEWRAKNYSKLSADQIGRFADGALKTSGVSLSPAAKISLYVRYLRRAVDA